MTTKTKKMWTDLHQILCKGSYGEREDQVRISLRLIEGCGSNGQNLLKPATVYNIVPSANSKLAGRKIVSVASVGDKNAFAGICTLLEYFPSSSQLICCSAKRPKETKSHGFLYTNNYQLYSIGLFSSHLT